jgi:DNA-binding SARP family transcriptional activator
MSRLELSFLGPFQVRLDGVLVTSFEADKVRALLAYLAVESDHPHRREQLAALFWPGWPDASARTSLRNALSNLRKAIGEETAEPPFLLISRETIQFNPESDYFLDTLELERLTRDSHATADQLESAVSLYGALSWKASPSRTARHLTTGLSPSGSSSRGRPPGLSPAWERCMRKGKNTRKR